MIFDFIFYFISLTSVLKFPQTFLHSSIPLIQHIVAIFCATFFNEIFRTHVCGVSLVTFLHANSFPVSK